MTREIKFRAWDRNEEMHQLELEAPEDYMAVLTGKWAKVNVMQYTGLKDKNGVEIYEGDVLQAGKLLAVVEFIHTEFCAMAELPDMDDCATNLICWDEASVIGNIYENPELLKRED